MSYRPGNVDTNMNQKNDRYSDFISSERAAEVCLRDLGNETMTVGDHESMALQLALYPTKLADYYIYKALEIKYKKKISDNKK